MEKVFWLMWLADVVGNIGLVAVFALIVVGGTIGLAALLSAAEEWDDVKRLFRVLRWLAIPVIIGMLLPSSSTLKLMALSSAGEVATETQLGKKGVEALNAVLDKVISESKK